MFKGYISSVSSIFRRMLQIFHLDVSKVDLVEHMLQCSVGHHRVTRCTRQWQVESSGAAAAPVVGVCGGEGRPLGARHALSI